MRIIAILAALLWLASSAYGKELCGSRGFPDAAPLLGTHRIVTQNCADPTAPTTGVTVAEITTFVHVAPVGIDTDAPAATLHVLAGGTEFAGFGADQVATLQNDGTAPAGVILSLVPGATGSAQVTFGDAAGAIDGRILYDNVDEEFEISAGGGVVATFEPDGDVEVAQNVTAQGFIAVCTQPVSAVACTPNQLCCDDSFCYHCNAAGTAWSRAAFATF